jgi:hypothetical protein
MESFDRLKEDLDSLLGINRQSNSWTWTDLCSPESGLHDPSNSTCLSNPDEYDVDTDWPDGIQDITVVEHHPWRIRRWL